MCCQLFLGRLHWANHWTNMGFGLWKLNPRFQFSIPLGVHPHVPVWSHIKTKTQQQHTKSDVSCLLWRGRKILFFKKQPFVWNNQCLVNYNFLNNKNKTDFFSLLYVFINTWTWVWLEKHRKHSTWGQQTSIQIHLWVVAFRLAQSLELLPFTYKPKMTKSWIKEPIKFYHLFSIKVLTTQRPRDSSCVCTVLTGAPNMIENYLTYKVGIFLRYKTWCSDVYVDNEMLTTI